MSVVYDDVRNRIYSDRDFYTSMKNDDVEKLRDYVIAHNPD